MNTLTTKKKHDIIKSVWIIATLALSTSVPVAAHAEDHASTDTGMIRDQTVPLLRTPAKFKPHRQTAFRKVLEEGEEICLFDAEGPGCLRHFWISTDCSGPGLRIRIHVDDAKQPQVDMELNHFFGILLDKKPYNVESPGIKVLPLGSRNCYLPIPFAQSCRITVQAGDIKGRVDAFGGRITDADPKHAMLFFQANWQEYADAANLTPYRLHAHFHEERPAQSKGTFYMADITGKGFVAGMFKAIAKREGGDLLYHTGGGTWLIDGETDPNAFRGFNEEDDFNFSWGYFPYKSQWSGCPYVTKPGPEATEFVAWRFFGPDPVPFNSSLAIHFGSRADDTQSVLYYYKVPEAGEYRLRIGHDDWLKIWVNGRYIKTLRHEKGFDVATVPIKLQAGANRIMLKLNNMNNREYRLWALNFSVRP